jgi:hypothetical protein
MKEEKERRYERLIEQNKLREMAKAYDVHLKAVSQETSIAKDMLKEAYIIICRGVDLMPSSELGKWQGIRAWIEEVGEYLELDEGDNTDRT